MADDRGPLRVVGKPIPMLEGRQKVSGAAKYTQDVSLPGMLVGRVLRSPHAHAALRRLDTRRARALPGVAAVITADDSPKVKYVHLGDPFRDRYPLAVETVRFEGEEVAAVAAETAADAERALGLIDVEYRPLPAAMTLDEAMAAEAPQVHAHAPGNVAFHHVWQWGDVEAGFASADAIVEGWYSYPSQAPACMETNACVAQWDERSGRLTVWTGTQSPYFIRKELSTVLALPPEQVRVMEIATGGGFGGKSKICEHEAVCALLAMKAGRPVKLVLTREEEFATTKTRHAVRIWLRTGVTKDGRLVARDGHIIMNNGAYNATGPRVLGIASKLWPSLYRVPAARIEGTLVYTNRQPGGQFRGFGTPQANFAIESQMDEVAEAIGMDPLQFRLMNAVQPGDVTVNGYRIGTCGLEEGLRTVGTAIGWQDKREKKAPWRGVGVATNCHASGPLVYADGNFSEAAIDVTTEGRVVLRTGSSDPGTWSNTALAQIAAEEVGARIEDLSVISMDTEETPIDLGSWASRVTFVTGNAVRCAASAVRQRLVARAAQLLEANPDDLTAADSRVHSVDDATRGLTFAQLMEGQPPISVQERYDTPLIDYDVRTGTGNVAPSYSFSAHAVEVEVDPDTGRISVLAYVTAEDAGRVINPLGLEGQVKGGVIQGLGGVLREELIYEGGHLVNGSFLNYGVSRSTDVPSIESNFIQTNDPIGPLGAKAGGEDPITPVGAAIANAVYHATGVRIKDAPLTPDKIVAALRAREGTPLAPPSGWRHPSNWRVHGIRSLYPSVVFPVLHTVGTRFARRPSGPARPDVVVASDLADALGHLARHGKRAKVLAGGTDLIPGIRHGIHRPEVLIDTSRVAELASLGQTDGWIVIGGGVRLVDVERAAVIGDRLPLLSQAVARLANPLVRNMSTVAGNLCQEKRCWFFRTGMSCYKLGGVTCPCYAVLGDNRNHAIMDAERCAAPCPSDLAPALVAAGAEATIASRRGVRRLPLERFYRWAGEPALDPDEIVTEVRVPVPDPTGHAAFEKVSLRENDFATASVAVDLRMNGRRCVAARVALGGVSPFPRRADAAERLLTGAVLDEEALRRAARMTTHKALPLAGNAYKVDLVQRLFLRAMHRALGSHA